MMVEQQPQKCSPVDATQSATAEVATMGGKSSSNGVSQAAANGDDAASADVVMTPTTTTTPRDDSNTSRPHPRPPVPQQVLDYAPLLVGKYYIEDKRAVWSGTWGMTEAAFRGKGLVSPFEMKSEESVYIPTAPAGSADTVHPSFFDVALARSSQSENPSPSEVSPAFLGYETNPEVRSAMPFLSKYSGFFQIQAVKGKFQTVTEKDVEMRFVHDATNPSFFAVTGTGENRFGLFTLHGFLDKTTSELRVYKIYKPKEPKEREKKPVLRRTRGAPKTPLMIPPTPVAATHAAPLPPTTSAARPTITPTAALAQGHATPSRSLGTPMSDYSSPTLSGRARSGRKVIIPAHLREENVIELDRVPASVKKCHSILKSMMASSKATPFLAPVDPVALGIPDYFQVIKEPMDLGTIKQNVECGYYDDPTVFVDHVRLVFRNAMLYNPAHSQVHIFAQKLLEDFEKRIKSMNLKPSAKEKTIQKQASIKMKKERKSDTHHSSKKIKGGKGSKGNTKRRVSGDETGLIMSLKEDIERLKATLEQLQPSIKITTPKTPKIASRRPFKMSDLTEDELNDPMTQQEKARLSADIKSLPQDKINRVLQIIAEAVPVAKLANENDEIELDINAFDTRCLRMLEGYVRENGIGRKRKRPTVKKSKSLPTENRLKSAKVAAMNIRYRQEELKNQLAAIDRDGSATAAAAAQEKRVVDPDVAMTDVDGSVDANGDVERKDQSGNSSDSSSSSSDSSDSDDSDSDSESDSDDGGAPLERSPPLASAPALSQIAESARGDPAKKIRDEVASSEPLRVENRGAWSMLAKKDTPEQSLIRSEGNDSSSLWLSARSMEQQKKQKERERGEEIEAQRRREQEIREMEKQREREESERRKQEHARALQKAEDARRREEEERAREAERERAARRAAAREKLPLDEEEAESHEHTLSEDLESFSSSSFL